MDSFGPDDTHSLADSKPNTRRRIAGILAAWWANPKKRFVGIGGALLVLLAVVFAVPSTRYDVLGLFVKESVTVTVVDSQSGQPIQGVLVHVGGKQSTTDGSGAVTFRVKPGTTKVTVTKEFYGSTTRSFTVTLSNSHNKLKQPIVALGRQVPVVVVDAVSGRPLANAEVVSGGGDTRTDKAGQAVVTVASSASSQDASIRADGYKTRQVSIAVTGAQVPANSFRLVPAGTVYFLSNKSGSIDVVASDLDGENRRVVLAGTGNEDPQNTRLSISPDANYLALLSRRTRVASGLSGLYLIDTTKANKLSTIDQGAQTFNLAGWIGDQLVYTSNQNDGQYWQGNRQAIKTYDALGGKKVVLAQNVGEGTGVYDFAASQLGAPFVLRNEVVYLDSWFASSSFRLQGKTDTLVSVRPDGSGRKVVKAMPIPDSVSYFSPAAIEYSPNGIYLQVPEPPGNGKTYFEYEDGKIKSTPLSDADFYKSYGPYFISPSGNATLWVENRDGISTLLIGDSDAANGKVIASLKDFVALGWFSESYLLASKGGSELYLVAVDGNGSPLKITDYFAATSYGER